jgi:hypothetical protein
LQALLDAGLRVRAVVLPALSAPAVGGAPPPTIRRRPAGAPAQPQRRLLPLLTPIRERTIARLAAEHEIPVYEVARLAHAQTLDTLRAMAPDVM